MVLYTLLCTILLANFVLLPLIVSIFLTLFISFFFYQNKLSLFFLIFALLIGL